MSKVVEVDVLIAGGGPVGLSLAVELGLRGITCLVVERNDRVGYSPRAKTTNVRTREHLRRWGIADALRNASPIPPDYPPNVVFATRMNGAELARFENAFNGARVRNELYSEEAQWVPQYTLEEVLRQRATMSPGVAVAFRSELIEFTQSVDRVSATVLSSDSGERTVRCRYLIGADGARSSVRKSIGAKMAGKGASSRNCSIIFRAPELASMHAFGPAIMYWLVNADVPALLGPMDDHGLWFFMATKIDETLDLTTADPAELIRKGTGLDDLKIEVIRSDPWQAQSLVADRYSEGRVFLAGDACHLHPPFGGFGMNMGIGDAVDLGWKLAATLQGWGGPNLLSSYVAERRPVHERTIREAELNYGTLGNQLVSPELEDIGAAGDLARQRAAEIIVATKQREFYTLGLVLGARYERSPIIVSDSTKPPPEAVSEYLPSACPGGLAPHSWLADGSSLYDHFGTGLTLLDTGTCGSNSTAVDDGVNALKQEAKRRVIPLKILEESKPGLRELYGARFALIRPDQYVAWRGDRLPEPSQLLNLVLGITELSF